MEIILNKEGLAVENYSALVAYAKEQTAVYDGLVVEENAIAAAKKNTADLRKKAKEADRIRIEVKKQNELRIKEVADQLLQVAAIFNGSADHIDQQVKAFENKAKEEKRTELVEYFNQHGYSDLIKFDMVFDPKMLNKTFSISEAKKEIDRKVHAIEENLLTITKMEHPFRAEILQTYLETLDLAKAIQRGDLMKEREKKVEAPEEPKPEQKTNLPVYDCRKKHLENWLINATDDEFARLKRFCETMGIYWSLVLENDSCIIDDDDAIFGL